jgi:hypothetical protein
MHQFRQNAVLGVINMEVALAVLLDVIHSLVSGGEQ